VAIVWRIIYTIVLWSLDRTQVAKIPVLGLMTEQKLDRSFPYLEVSSGVCNRPTGDEGITAKRSSVSLRTVDDTCEFVGSDLKVAVCPLSFSMQQGVLVES
jgi:hypothetical protein